MQREIKFRVWCSVIKAWMAEDVIAVTGQNRLVDCLGMNKYLDSQYKSGGIIIQQFTGLRDKNGKEIYEGDFLRGAEYELPVKVIFSGAAFRLKYSNRELEFHESSEKIEMEIVGNIFENSNLLETT